MTRTLIAVALMASMALFAGCGGDEQGASARSPMSGGAGPEPGCHWQCPTCPPGKICPMLGPCMLVCNPQKCGNKACPAGQACCNPSCGICTEVGGYCTQQVCQKQPTAPSGCTSDADCSAYSNYCGYCSCVATLGNQKSPTCAPKDMVQCFMDPCEGKIGRCDLTTGTCVVGLI